MRIVKLLTMTIALVFAFGLLKTAQAEVATIFGPVYVDDNNCQRKNVKEGEFTFTAPVPGKGVLVVKTWKSQAGVDGRDDHGKEPGIRGAKIELNDQKIVRRKEFKKKVQTLNLDVDLQASNELEVKVKTCKRCEVMISVLGESQSTPTTPPDIDPTIPVGTPR